MPVLPNPILGYNPGNLLSPLSWASANNTKGGQSPPASYGAIPSGTNFPNNGDGRYWTTGFAGATTTIWYRGSPAELIGDLAITYQIAQVSDDGSWIQLTYQDVNGTHANIAIGGNAQGDAGVIQMSGTVVMQLGAPAIITAGSAPDLSKVGYSLGNASDPGTANEAFGTAEQVQVQTSNAARFATVVAAFLYTSGTGQTAFRLTLQGPSAPSQADLIYVSVITQKHTYILTISSAIFAQSGNFATFDWTTDWNGIPFKFNDFIPGTDYTIVCTPYQPKIIIDIDGGSGSGLQPMEVAFALTRNADSQPVWDSMGGPGSEDSNALNPINYNGEILFQPGYDTLLTLQKRLMIRLGFANQLAAFPPGMSAMTQEFLQSAQNFLYRRFTQLHTRRWFRWKLVPLQRFYSLLDNDENVLQGFSLDTDKTIEQVMVQDTRNVWYPLIEGIPAQLYTMLAKPWRPARYDIRNAIEIYPAPDQTYFLWVKGHFGLLSFSNPSDQTTVDSELVFLHALANAKAHYGHPDAQNIEAQANAMRANLIGATHKTAKYVPGTISVPPAVRPTLVQFNDTGNG